MAPKTIAVYPLSADPIHYGHLSNVTAAVTSGLFDEVVVALGHNPTKKYLFNLEERLDLAKRTVEAAGLDKTKVRVESFTGLLRNYAILNGADFIVKGCRNGTDWDYENLLSEFNDEYGLQTLVLPAKKELRNLSSTYVKAIAVEGGLVHELVHPATKQALEEKLRGVSLVGVTGNMGAGKSTFCNEIVEYAKNKDVEIHHVDFDKLVHSLWQGDSPLANKVKEKLVDAFGEGVFDSPELNRKKLAGIVFGDDAKRKQLADIVYMPALLKLEEEVRKMKGVVLVDAAYFTEYNMLPLVNYNVVVVGCEKQERLNRILKRDGLTKEQLEAKVKAQHSPELRKQLIKKAQEKQHYGFYHEVDSTNKVNFEDVLAKLQAYFPLYKSSGDKK